MSARLKRFLTGLLMLPLLAGAFVLQLSLSHERDVLGLTRYPELRGAPPVLAMTTVALGGFRGLISNLLWMRATDLQDQDKFFEMVQLADWITKLEPHFTQVWLVQSWNMAYNISVKFKDPADRWRWVQRGIELLRDEGLRYNPDDVLIHRELAWFFQHKMGANMDDAHNYYKEMWLKEMSKVLGTNEPAVNWDALIHPKTTNEMERAALLTNKFKLDPVFMKQLDEQYGPLEWRLPEAHAIYWAAQGLEAAKRNERRINPDDLITLHRVIYQSMQLSFQRGKLIVNNADRNFAMGPNLDIIPKVSAAYERAMDEDPKNRDHIQTAHRNFLRDAVYFLYTYNRLADAAQWYAYLSKLYPDKSLLDGKLDALPRTLSLDDYCIARLQEEVGDTSQEKTTMLLEGLESQAFQSLAVGQEDRYQGMDGMARKIWQTYTSKTTESGTNRVSLVPLPEIRHRVLYSLLTNDLSPALAAQLATAAGIDLTNLPPRASISTNAVPATEEPNK